MKEYLTQIAKQLIGMDFEDLTKAEKNIANILCKANVCEIIDRKLTIKK